MFLQPTLVVIYADENKSRVRRRQRHVVLTRGFRIPETVETSTCHQAPTTDPGCQQRHQSGVILAAMERIFHGLMGK